MSDASQPSGIEDLHIRRFAQRATWLRRAAYFILFVIFVLIVAGALVYQQAGAIAARDVGSGAAAPTHASLEELAITRESLERELALAREQRDSYRQQYEVGQRTLLEVLNLESQYHALESRHALLLLKIDEFRKTAAPVNINVPTTLEELNAVRDATQAFADNLRRIVDVMQRRLEAGGGSTADLAQARQQLENVNGNLQLLNQKIENFQVARAGEPESVTADLPVIIHTNITRFGTLIVIFFFISILVPIYRFNIQSAAFYDAVSDALLLIRDTGKGELTELVAALTPAVGFGKAPRTPIQEGAELVKTLARSRQS